MLFKSPAITILLLYVFVIVILDFLGIFAPRGNSYLIHCTNRNSVTVTGKVSDEPAIKNNVRQFVLEVSNADDIAVKEKTMVYAPPAYNINYGDIICLSGRPAEIEKPVFPDNFNYNLYLQRQNIYTKFYLYDFESADKKPNFVKTFSLKVKEDIQKKFEKFFKPEHSSVLESMFIGGKDSLDKETKNSFIKTGIIHILVISGLHIGFWAVIFIFVFKLFNLPLKCVYLLTVPALFFYAFMTGAHPPAVRASIMASCVLICLILDREPLIYNAIALSALIILLYDPQALFTASFQLSFSATLGIIYLYPKINGVFGKIKNKIYKIVWNIVCVTLSAQIAVLPFLIFYFGQLSAVSPFVNVLIVPTAGFIVWLAFIFYASTFISGFLAAAVSFLLSHTLDLILGIINFFANFKFASTDLKRPDAAEILFYYSAIIIMIEFSGNKKVLAALFFAIILMFFTPFEKQPFRKVFIGDKNITVHIRSKNKENAIIYDEIKRDKHYFVNLEQYLLAHGIKRIDRFYVKNAVFTDLKDIKNKLPKIEIKTILEYPKTKIDRSLSSCL